MDITPVNTLDRQHLSDHHQKVQTDKSNSAVTEVDSAQYKNGLKRFLTPSTYREEPPPDGGLQAWIQVFVGFLSLVCIWGYLNSWGVFQSHYVAEFDTTQSTVSWIVSFQICLLNLLSSVSGRLFDAGYYRPTFACGAVLQVLSIMMTSLCTKYWQVFLAQGLCGGIAAGLLWCPAVSLITTYFAKRRCIALAFVLSGSSVGGLIFPIIYQHLQPKIGFGWTVRVIGFIELGLFAVVLTLARTRINPRPSGPFFDPESFKDPSYTLFTIGTFIMYWAVYNAFFYINSYAEDIINIPSSQSLTLLYLMNGVSIAGRIIPAIFADRYFGAINTFIFLTAIAGIVMYCWSAVSSLTSLEIWAAFYGFFGSGLQGLFGAALAGLTTDLRKMGVRMGMVLSIGSVAALTGSPIAGALIQHDGGSYIGMQVFGGSCLCACAAIVTMAALAGKGYTILNIWKTIQ
ncbi:MFS general substrate transporter [Saccharata proteae CBS 121410]|uniref:MFS general substrate transporter n=1 Tax=Saccharata proteae CBS 121410 TaxID=1314787 RepID=A0A9P4LRZ3_9PEZI|nr:MFS general substrate transporter [Saccharata proteae CBS 121410]